MLKIYIIVNVQVAASLNVLGAWPSLPWPAVGTPSLNSLCQCQAVSIEIRN